MKKHKYHPLPQSSSCATCAACCCKADAAWTGSTIKTCGKEKALYLSSDFGCLKGGWFGGFNGWFRKSVKEKNGGRNDVIQAFYAGFRVYSGSFIVCLWMCYEGLMADSWVFCGGLTGFGQVDSWCALQAGMEFWCISPFFSPASRLWMLAVVVFRRTSHLLKEKFVAVCVAHVPLRNQHVFLQCFMVSCTIWLRKCNKTLNPRPPTLSNPRAPNTKHRLPRFAPFRAAWGARRSLGRRCWARGDSRWRWVLPGRRAATKAPPGREIYMATWG